MLSRTLDGLAVCLVPLLSELNKTEFTREVIQDFALRADYPAAFLGENADSQQAPTITASGTEHPGFTSSLAVEVLPQNPE